ncbi:uncharacterized protein LOC100570914 isoform X1 [Acyrthosiphon pisum]|uniref:Uncharacterized protein n=1 Tax=Acyrthosiphon pisum TaxID=7029 RepID=A0A8R2F6M9_ACYPI|nr:uncharacterized protein LOC100570914 isoform X1 [Acyrthosiphon pisum]|eukprot:XP_008181039.1 PREDICTED: uncharacterized protein LOC100570914 isoform X1 [Acyrthosiphon pisum]
MLLIPRILVVVAVMLTVTNVEVIAPKPIDDAHRLRVLSQIFKMVESEIFLRCSNLRPELQELIRSLRKDLQQSTPPTSVNQKLSIIFASMEYKSITCTSYYNPVINSNMHYSIGIKFQPSEHYSDTLVNYSEMLENSDDNTEFMSNLRQWIRLLVQAERRFIETIPVNQKTTDEGLQSMEVTTTTVTNDGHIPLVDLQQNSSKPHTTHEEAHGQVLPVIPVVISKTSDGGPQILEVTTRTDMIDGNILMVNLQQNSSEPHTKLEETRARVLPTVLVVPNKTTDGGPKILEVTTRIAMIDGKIPLVDLQQNSSEPHTVLKEAHTQVFPTVPVIPSEVIM